MNTPNPDAAWNLPEVRPGFDMKRDREILAERAGAFLQADPERPQTGDVLLLAGETYRVAQVWPDGVQPALGGSYYLGSSYMSYSGSLEPTIRRWRIRPTHQTTLASCWFFDRDWRRAGGAVEASIRVRVFEVEFGPEPAPAPPAVRAGLTPFLGAGSANKVVSCYRQETDTQGEVVSCYLYSGTSFDVSFGGLAVLRDVAKDAAAWNDPEVRAAGLALQSDLEYYLRR